jgi:hypothetical protein
MTLIFQILAIVAVVAIAIVVVRGGGARHQAVRRILLVLFVLGAAVAVLFPQVLTWLANLVGIGRGTDLLLYVMVIAFLALVATTYRRFRQMEEQITTLARRVALLDSDPTPGRSASRDPNG